MKLSFNKKYFKNYKRNFNYIHETAPITFQTFEIEGEKYLQIDCYKKNIDIKNTGALEQSNQKIQFDKETAINFIGLLKSEFNI